MPYFINPFDDENKKNEQSDQSNIISGSSNTFSNQQSANQSPVKSEKSSGAFTNLNKYLDANQEQAGEMGNKIVNSVESVASGAQNKINGLAQEKQNTTQVDTNKYLSDPTKNSDEDIQNYQQLRSNGGYSGPNDISGTTNYGEALKQTENAYQKVQNAGTEEGRIQLLQDEYKRPTYSRGSQVLDNLLLQGNEQSKNSLNDINQKYSGLKTQLETTATDVGNSINQSKLQALENKKLINTAEEETWNNLINPIQQRAVQYNADSKDLVNRIGQDLQDETLTDETLRLLGIKEGQKLYDMNLNSYVTPDLTEAGIDNVANADERAKYLALQRLIQDPSRTQITADGKAINPVTFNQAQFDKDFNAKDAEFKRFAEATNVHGSSGRYSNADPDFYTQADYNNILANQLAGIQASPTYSYGRGAPVAGERETATAIAQQNFLARLNEILNQQNYYRTVKKG